MAMAVVAGSEVDRAPVQDRAPVRGPAPALGVGAVW